MTGVLLPAEVDMATPPAPPHDELSHRPFSFYPPIVGIDHNEWRLEQAAWSEMIVRNTKTGLEIGIPRRYFGEVSKVEEPVMIVGLRRELEYKMGAVWPYERKVLAMGTPFSSTVRHGSEDQPQGPHGLDAIVGPGMTGTESRISKLILWSFASVVAVGALFWVLVRLVPEARPSFVAKDQDYLMLTRSDDYFAVVRKLGPPTEDRWKSATGELQHRGLVYKDRAYMVILMGSDREGARYIGTMYIGRDGREWKPLHSVEFARGTSTASMLRNMQRF